MLPYVICVPLITFLAALETSAHSGPRTGEPTFSDPEHNLLCGETLAVEGGVATQHGVLQTGMFITQDHTHTHMLMLSPHQNDSEAPEVTGLCVAITW